MFQGEKEINTDLDNLKMFFKIHVFMLLFHFFSEGLPKYDNDDPDLPNQFDDDLENLPKLSTKLYLNNSIVCLDDLKDSIACKMDMYLIFDRYNIKKIKEELSEKGFSLENHYENSQLCRELRFNIVKCNPYFCKYSDLDGTKSFKKINKRELVKPFALCYSSKNKVERYSDHEFRINYNLDIVIEKVSVKMSIEQISSLLSMIHNTSAILKEKYIDKIKNDGQNFLNEKRSPNNSLTKKTVFDEIAEAPVDANRFKETYEIFSNRYNMLPEKISQQQNYDVDEEEDKTAISSKDANIVKLKSPTRISKKADIEGEQATLIDNDESKGKNDFSFFFHGLSVYFINDYKENFYPVLCLALKETNYERKTRADGSFVSQSHIDANFDYYNVHNGHWEPFIEGLNIDFLYDKQAESKVIQIKGTESINLNLSADFIAVVSYCMKSWNLSQKHQIEKEKELRKAGGEIFQEEEKQEIFDEDIRTEQRATLLNMFEDEEVVDIATPYQVRNLTGMSIFIETLFDNKKDNKKKYILTDGQSTKIAVSYEKQANKSYKYMNTKLNDNISIQFQGLYLPIKSNSHLTPTEIPLNRLQQQIHKLTESDEEYDFVYYETKVIDMNKVLTLRTQNLLINSTQFAYDVVI